MISSLLLRYISISTHDLTRRLTVIAEKLYSIINISTHDLARRSTLAIVRDEQVCYYFNSRPRKEVDLYGLLTRLIVCISTHDLTRRSTHFSDAARHVVRYFNSRPHEEVDPFFFNAAWKKFHFNSRPHEEVDVFKKLYCIKYIISTHDLTRRSTMCLQYRILQTALFQLTTSRGGRRRLYSNLYQAHNISTHDLTRRSTSTSQSGSKILEHFNSRPHEEVDREEPEQKQERNISTHDLARRSTS